MSLIRADARAIPLRDACVQCVVTSPPYWALRDYGVPGQLGLEPTPEAYIANMVAVFREVRRVLAEDGTLWLNLGDSYNSGTQFNHHSAGLGDADRYSEGARGDWPGHRAKILGLKTKDLVGIPWRVAFALQADGWYLRSDIIWSKPNPMPESVTDRPTKAHEYIFLLAKGQWKSRVVAFSNLACQRFHFSQYFGPDGFPVRGAARLPVDLAAAIFYRAEREYQVGLPPFYSEVWAQSPDGRDSDFVCGLPIEQRASVWAARFLCSHATAEQFLCEIDRLRVAHADGDYFLKGWAQRSSGANAPCITSDGKGTVTVHYPGEICKVDFTKHVVIISRPYASSYYYDAEAILESAVPQTRTGLRGYVCPKDVSNSYLQGGRKFSDKSGLNGPTGDSRNKRSVWHVATQPYAEAHFATFPEALIEPCILAGSRVGDLVFDPFIGSGTVGKVCERFMRRWVGTDLTYQHLARERTAQMGLRVVNE